LLFDPDAETIWNNLDTAGLMLAEGQLRTNDNLLVILVNFKLRQFLSLPFRFHGGVATAVKQSFQTGIQVLERQPQRRLRGENVSMTSGG